MQQQICITYNWRDYLFCSVRHPACAAVYAGIHSMEPCHFRLRHSDSGYLDFCLVYSTHPVQRCGHGSSGGHYVWYLATKHLISLGHRRILHLTHDTSRLTGQLRLDGYKKALIESNIPIDKNLILSCPSRKAEDIRTKLDHFIGSTNFTAIFAGSDHRAISAMDYFREKGYRIESLAIVDAMDDDGTIPFRR